MGSINPRLHTNEVLIALSLSAKNKEEAQKTLCQLKNLKNAQAHITCSISPIDLSTFKQLGIQITYEAQKR